ncbi:MAG: hypothetical protein AAGJ81_14220 [Verrucomicrobiota bacterium]
MKSVELSDQGVEYVRGLPPVPNKRIRAALKSLAKIEGDLMDLEHPLDGYCRLRVYQFRIILKIHQKKIDCIFIERKSLVYEVFEANYLR